VSTLRINNIERYTLVLKYFASELIESALQKKKKKKKKKNQQFCCHDAT
jgi:hypothetical protein